MSSSASETLAGRQAPRILHRPPWASEAAGEEAIDLAESVGLHLDPWQQHIVRVALSERADGKWAAPEVGYLVARQNGKGGALEAIVLHGMFLVEDPLTLWTAHQFKTSTEAFLRIRGWIDGSDDLRRQVSRVNAAHGEEGFELRSGARLRFVARSKSSGRGFSPQRIIFDEAQELSTLAVDAMVPSMSAQANPQAIYTGTVPSVENNAEHWARVRDRGRSKVSDRLAWLEWTPKGSEDPRVQVDLDDRRNWAASNPALGYRLTEEYVAGERESLSAESFGQERLSIWPTDDGGSGVIDVTAWSDCRAPLTPPTTPVILAVETVMDRSSSSLVAVGSGPGDRAQVKVLRTASGTAWVPAMVVQVAREHREVEAIVIDGRAAAASLVDAITAALDVAGVDVDLVVTNSSDVAQACGQIMDAIRDGTIRHAGDPTLDAAVRGAVQRDMGDGAWAWSRRKGGPVVAPLVAMTLAHWQWRQLMDTPSPMSQIF